MGSRQTINAFPEQSSSHDRNSLGRAPETTTDKRTRAATRSQKKGIEPKQEPYGMPSQSLVDVIRVEDNESYDTSSRAESTSTRTRTSRRNKRTQERAELDEPESSTSHNTASTSRPNKRRATRAEEEVTRNEQEHYPIIILPPLSRTDSPHPTIRRTEELDAIQDSPSYMQPLNLPATGNNTGGVTLPPISLPQENSTHGGITLPPIRSVLPLGLDNYTERSRTPEINNEIEVVDLTSPPSYPGNNAADPYPSNVVDLTSSPVVVNSPHINSNDHSIPEIIVIDDDSSEAPSSAGSPSPPRGLQLKCAICLDHPKDVSATSCGHIFCRECISTALRSQKVCSLCRHPLTKKQIKRLEFKVM